MIIHVSFNRLSAPETKLLIYIQYISIRTTKLNFSHPVFLDTNGYFFYMLLLAHFEPRNFLAHALQHCTPRRWNGEIQRLSPKANESWLIYAIYARISSDLLVVSCYFLMILISLAEFPVFFGTKWNLQIFSSVFHPLWHLDSACSNGHKASSRYNLWIS